MPTQKSFLLLYLILINLTAFAQMGIDKHKAKKKAWRIPEKTLFFSAVIGGSPGAILGMLVFHHKTRHRAFKYGMPLILCTQLLLVFFALLKFSNLFTNH
ncbi:MAG: DUF1294 domain-containing protein [Lachnospiraceae bacterium]|nr:DUF1294 domain-containing protein [Lachnospiraceae bacterium]MBP5222436.1 DUF1294 domain-containing protein [Lachnospiraceae bacterium]